ncbi:hypothetical protein JCM1840_001674 [Sporobolomyces johnsonii]
MTHHEQHAGPSKQPLAPARERIPSASALSEPSGAGIEQLMTAPPMRAYDDQRAERDTNTAKSAEEEEGGSKTARGTTSRSRIAPHQTTCEPPHDPPRPEGGEWMRDECTVERR